MPDPVREESTCRWCGQPVWLVHRSKCSNHTVEGRAIKQRDEELRERMLKLPFGRLQRKMALSIFEEGD